MKNHIMDCRYYKSKINLRDISLQSYNKKCLERSAFFILFMSFLYMSCYAQNISPKVKRILFVGNSITWAGGYVNDVEAYLTIHYPNSNYEIINVGLPSETVSGLSEPGHAGGAFPRPDLHERLERVLSQTKPDLVFACYGMNDGILLPFDEGRFQKFKDGIYWLHNEVLKTGARLIHLTPPCYDELKGKSIGYANVLDRYSDWLLSLRKSAKWEVVDIHYPMQKYLGAHRKIDAEFKIDGFSLQEDGVHPGAAGHWIMAKQILLYLGCGDVANYGSIAANLIAAPNGLQVLKLVTERQNLMRDAWLTATKFKRPGMPTGLPLGYAQSISDALKLEIHALVENKKIAEVYLIGGQSNATGQGYLANMADTMKVNKQVLLFHSGKPHLESGSAAYTWQPMHQASESPDRFGPELGFSEKIKPFNAGAQIAVIKHAHSGTNLYSEWSPGANNSDSVHFGAQYKEFLKTVNAGLDSLKKRGYFPIIKGMLWQQGEAEAYSPDSISVQYGLLLKHFIGKVREQFSVLQMAFVYGYICPPPLTSPGIKTVRQAQHDIDQGSGMALAVPGAFVIPTDDLSHRSKDRNTPYPNDELHFGTDGTWLLGVRMAEKMNQALVGNI
jgi:lysophospholipase L1-like esterase